MAERWRHVNEEGKWQVENRNGTGKTVEYKDIGTSKTTKRPPREIVRGA